MCAAQAEQRAAQASPPTQRMAFTFPKFPEA